MIVQCNSCNHDVKFEEYDKHYKRCSSVKYIQRKMKSLYNQDIKYSDLYYLNDIEFNKKYNWVLNQVYEKTNDVMEKRALENILLGVNNELKDIMQS